MKSYGSIYKQELLKEIIPFWEKYSPDYIYGGYFTCLNSEGKVYDTDKFVWLQAREAWMFATLEHSSLNGNQWHEMAQLGIDFLEKYGQAPSGDWYFSLSQKGEPLMAPYNIFSDCFAAMAFGAFYKIDPNPKYKKLVKEIFKRIIARKDNPKGIYNKHISGTRPMKNFALPMILCNLSLELEHILGIQQVTNLTQELIPLIMEQFYDSKTGLILENISINGEFVNSFEGRLLNPGHAIEAMWFIMNIAIKQNNRALIEQAETILYQQLEHGWDKLHGGIFYFLDLKGFPPQQLEWDQKLWWVHLETLVALAKIYSYNKSLKAKDWFKKVHEYTWNHFRDPIHKGEWFGYLNRQGKVLLQLKGGKWKGCFHIPRALMQISNALETL